LEPGEGRPPCSLPGAVEAPAVGAAEVADANGLFSGWAGAEGCPGAAAGGGFVLGDVVVGRFVLPALVLGGVTIGVLICCSMIRRE